jgi:hypothetical protein
MKKISLLFIFIIFSSFFNLSPSSAETKEQLKIIDLQIQQANLPAEDEIKTNEPSKQTDQQASEQAQEENIYPVNDIKDQSSDSPKD